MCGRGTRVELRRMVMARPVIYTRFDQSATNLRSADERLPRANFQILGFKMNEWYRYHPLPQRPPSPTVHGCAIYNPLPFAYYSPTAFVPAMMSPDASFPAVSTPVLATRRGYRGQSDFKLLAQEFVSYDYNHDDIAITVGCRQVSKRNPPLTS